MSAVATVNHEMTVASWNIREALPVGADPESDRTRARREIQQVVDQRDIDVLAIQELDFEDERTSHTLAYLRDNTALTYCVSRPLSPSSYFPGRQAGVAIASRTPVTDEHAEIFPNPRLVSTRDGTEIHSHDKGFVSGVVHPGAGIAVTVASLHALPFYLFDRSPEDSAFDHVWFEMSRGLSTLTSKHLMICGDFNSPNRTPLLASGLLDVSSTNRSDTYRSMCSDDVLVSQRVSAVTHDVVANFSDHATVIGKFVVS